ncbi:amidohydrolase family protein [Mycobacteroides abscessus]|uniref:amidohydrolase family protein n=1 Tax=Mycobacteroides abscessus TaxID=36809 RepID=UPI000929CC53|nr:amidohydrolase family protein [Mycobacteroides abscessus]MCU8694064.1 amidohydrolase [Mycobacteroides abscessus]MCU8713272.1 amidohydrolase [Mycobacteroides abscessus]MCU8718017.1 amidohydrolase [Mycobacteroides abscessus]MCU8752175.1 amidohydrolase [Mycobacteroides abscessus]MCU8761635.1 amidohydrolase [Mycobacteroides abscessus]
MARIDTHQHIVPDLYRQALRRHGIGDLPSLSWPDWTPDLALDASELLGVDRAILSVSAPGTTFTADAHEATSLARRLNDYTRDLVGLYPNRFGFFATLPMPHISASVAEAVRALDELAADGIVLLANSGGVYLGQAGQDELFGVLDDRSAVVFIHPNALPAAPPDGVPPFAVDFLLDTTRAAYLLVRNGIRARFPNIRFILSHGGGFVPYASHRMAFSLELETGNPAEEMLALLSSFYFDTAVTSSPASLPSLLAFADSGHVVYGSDWPFLPADAARRFTGNLGRYLGLDDRARAAIDRGNAEKIWGTPPPTRDEVG